MLGDSEFFLKIKNKKLIFPYFFPSILQFHITTDITTGYNEKWSLRILLMVEFLLRFVISTSTTHPTVVTSPPDSGRCNDR